MNMFMTKLRLSVLLICLILIVSFAVLQYYTGTGEVTVPSNMLKGINDGELPEDVKAGVIEAYGKLPLYFIRNNGQMDAKVKYYEKGSGHSTFFTQEGVYISLHKGRKRDSEETRYQETDKSNESDHGTINGEVLKLTFSGANMEPEIIADGLQDGKLNYFIGNDPEKWHTGVPTYKDVLYRGVYDGIDVKFYGTSRSLEYDVIVEPGADPSGVKFLYEGIERLSVTDEGDMEISLKEGKVIQNRPYCYQEINGKRVEVEVSFKLLNSQLVTRNSQLPTPNSQLYAYSFEVASYDKSHALIIDPVLTYSTYLGGSGDDGGYGIAVDGSGNAYITGYTDSTDFPTLNAIQGTNAGSGDAFVTKINAAGTALVYSTYLGGSSSFDSGRDIAVDGSGNAYITGETGSTDFPTLNAIQGTNAGGSGEVFVTKINAAGTALVYSTYLGGSGDDWVYGIAVDGSGNAYIAGYGDSTDFPTLNAIQGTNAGSDDVFVTKINAAGTALVYSTYLGGSLTDVGYGIAVDSSGNAYIAGYTYSTDFPTLNAIQGTNAGGTTDAFVTKINAAGTAIVYSTYLGGSATEYGRSIAVDGSGNAYITGETYSTDFPTLNAIQGTNAGGPADVFVTKINAAGTAIVYSTYLGGSSSYDSGRDIAVDGSGNVYITGFTGSADFPTLNAIQGTNAGGTDVFVTKIDATCTALAYSTYLGGSGSDDGWGIAVDSSGNAYITGETDSTDFPTLNAIQGTNAGGLSDVFVTQVGVGANPTPNIKANCSEGPVTPIDNLSVTVTLDPGSRSGDDADWWLAAKVSDTSTIDGWYYFDLSTFRFVPVGDSPSNLIVTHQGTLFDLTTYQILNIPVSILPPGTYTFYFAVDTNRNGVLDIGELFFDFVVVTITP